MPDTRSFRFGREELKTNLGAPYPPQQSRLRRRMPAGRQAPRPIRWLRYALCSMRYVFLIPLHLTGLDPSDTNTLNEVPKQSAGTRAGFSKTKAPLMTNDLECPYKA